MDYHLLDDSHVEILAGDISSGLWKIVSGKIMHENGLAVPLERNIKSLDVRLKRKVGNLDTVSELPVGNIIGLGLGMALGPLGGLASKAVGMIAGNHEFLCIGCQLTDGRKFIAWMRTSVYEQLKKLGDAKH
jgi:hypothetical protein